jgi:hypothetical protein
MMMGGHQKKAAEDCHKLTMECCKKTKAELWVVSYNSCRPGRAFLC